MKNKDTVHCSAPRQEAMGGDGYYEGYWQLIAELTACQSVLQTRRDTCQYSLQFNSNNFNNPTRSPQLFISSWFLWTHSLRVTIWSCIATKPQKGATGSL